MCVDRGPECKAGENTKASQNRYIFILLHSECHSQINEIKSPSDKPWYVF